MEYQQFEDVSTYINGIVKRKGKLSLDFYNKILTKAIQKNNTKLAFEIFDTTRDIVTPDDTTYITLIEAFIEKSKLNEAFTLFFQASLRGRVLDLILVERLLDEARRKHIEAGFIVMLYHLATANFSLKHRLFKKFISSAVTMKNEEGGPAFLQKLMADGKQLNLDIMKDFGSRQKRRRSYNNAFMRNGEIGGALARGVDDFQNFSASPPQDFIMEPRPPMRGFEGLRSSQDMRRELSARFGHISGKSKGAAPGRTKFIILEPRGSYNGYFDDETGAFAAGFDEYLDESSSSDDEEVITKKVPPPGSKLKSLDIDEEPDRAPGGRNTRRPPGGRRRL